MFVVNVYNRHNLYVGPNIRFHSRLDQIVQHEIYKLVSSVIFPDLVIALEYNIPPHIPVKFINSNVKRHIHTDTEKHVNVGTSSQSYAITS